MFLLALSRLRLSELRAYRADELADRDVMFYERIRGDLGALSPGEFSRVSLEYDARWAERNPRWRCAVRWVRSLARLATLPRCETV